MSSYFAITRHPKTHKWVEAAWIDNHFGPKHYGVKFHGSSQVFDPQKYNLPVKRTEI